MLLQRKGPLVHELLEAIDRVSYRYLPEPLRSAVAELGTAEARRTAWREEIVGLLLERSITLPVSAARATARRLEAAGHFDAGLEPEAAARYQMSDVGSQKSEVGKAEP